MIDDSNLIVTPKRGRPSKNLSPVQQLLAEPMEIDDSSLIENTQRTPGKNDPDWTNYVLGTLPKEDKDEKGFPRAAGLKRLIQKFLGEIIKSQSILRFNQLYQNEAGEIKFSASAEHTLEIQSYDGLLYTFTGVGGANEYNTDKPYSRYPESVASTRAYVRAMRDALNLNCIAAEELSEVARELEDVPFVSQTELNSEDKSLTKELAKQLLSKLNKFQCGEDIPDGIK